MHDGRAQSPFFSVRQSGPLGEPRPNNYAQNAFAAPERCRRAFFGKLFAEFYVRWDIVYLLIKKEEIHESELR